MAFTQADRDTVAAAIATGALRVRFADGREVTYQNGADLRAALALIDGELAGQSTTATPRYAFATFPRW
jgi:hypothetical protein